MAYVYTRQRDTWGAAATGGHHRRPARRRARPDLFTEHCSAPPSRRNCPLAAPGYTSRDYVTRPVTRYQATRISKEILSTKRAHRKTDTDGFILFCRKQLLNVLKMVIHYQTDLDCGSLNIISDVLNKPYVHSYTDYANPVPVKHSKDPVPTVTFLRRCKKFNLLVNFQARVSAGKPRATVDCFNFPATRRILRAK
ncbi:unnamed protein product [Spodoptera exigua]|nr:unnamed protein product [Spodoptera exigua]